MAAEITTPRPETKYQGEVVAPYNQTLGIYGAIVEWYVANFHVGNLPVLP